MFPAKADRVLARECVWVCANDCTWLQLSCSVGREAKGAPGRNGDDRGEKPAKMAETADDDCERCAPLLPLLLLPMLFYSLESQHTHATFLSVKDGLNKKERETERDRERERDKERDRKREKEREKERKRERERERTKCGCGRSKCLCVRKFAFPHPLSLSQFFSFSFFFFESFFDDFSFLNFVFTKCRPNNSAHVSVYPSVLHFVCNSKERHIMSLTCWGSNNRRHFHKKLFRQQQLISGYNWIEDDS